MPVKESRDVLQPQSIDDLQVIPKQLTAAFEPRHTSERIGLKASIRSVLNVPLPTPVEEYSSPSSLKVEASDRRASIVSLSGDIDMLIDQLELTRIETAAPSSSKIVQVPKGYDLALARDSSMFYQQRSEAKRFDKRKRDMGVLPKLSQPQKHGYRPEDLLWYDAITLKNCKDSDLDNEIHPLLHRDLFDDTPDHIYDQLIPGMRLASLFLSHPSCMQFWVTLAKGKRRIDHVMSERYHQTRHRISRNVPMTSENVNEAIGYMKDLGHAKTIHYTFADALKFEEFDAFGHTSRICTCLSDLEENHHLPSRCHIRLHSDFYIIAKKLSHMVYPDPAQKLRFNLILASLLVHELAHAVEVSQWRNRAPSNFEPFVLHHNEAELGRMWETYMFGGQLAPINDRVDGIYGIGTWNWPLPFGDLNPERTICFALPMSYVESIQQKSTWQKRYDLNDSAGCQTRFHVPRDGATSIYMNSVTTVSWTEEERVAKETLHESQVMDSEEPAKKKREKADGKAVAIHEVGAEPAETLLENITSSKTNLSTNDDDDDEEAEGKKNKETPAHAVNRIKREPMGVMSRRQRRLQQKKTHLPQKIESEELYDLEEPETPAPELAGKEEGVEGTGTLDTNIGSSEEMLSKEAPAAAADISDNPAVDDNPAIDIPPSTPTPTIPPVAVDKREEDADEDDEPNTTEPPNPNEETPEKDV
ncbi:MAG: hypothetical protein Q9168_007376 [Polycauliona sp. 1 TL-2023]